MKIIRIILFCLLGLSLIGCTGIFIFFQTFDTDQYLPQITQKASLALGRSVSIGHIGLGISSMGITLDAAPLTVADDPAFTTEPFITVDRVRISLDFRSLILRRQIHIMKILLQSPEVHFIRSQDGSINVQGIGQSGQPFDRHPEVKPKDLKVPLDSSPLELKMTGDKEQNNRAQRPIDDYPINIIIQDAAISFIDQDHAMPLDIWLRNINVSLKDVSLSNPMDLSFNASLYSNTPNVHANAFVLLDPLKRSIQIDHLKFQMDLSRLDANQLKDISSQTDNPVLKDTIGIMQLNLTHLDTAAAGGVAANGDISIIGGVISNFNIIKVLLSHAMENLGGVVSVDSLFKGSFKDKLDAKDTVIQNASAQFSVHDKTLFIDDSLIQTDIFELIAKGSIDQGLNTDMQTTLHLNNDVSADLVNELDMLQYLMDDSKRIAIGATLKGVIPHLKYKPNKDFRKKTKKAFIAGGGSILGVLLGGGKI
jgi:hypothetical protein